MKKAIEKIIQYYLRTAQLCVLLCLPGPVFGQEALRQIKINQLGFYPKSQKIAVVTGKLGPKKFYICSPDLQDTFFTGILGNEKQSAYSATNTRVADFSNFKRQGRYVMLVPGVSPSYVFEIGDHVFKQAAIAALKGFYYQRVSIPLEAKFAGKWFRPAGHADTLVYIHPSAATVTRPAGSSISSPGGWYDAGDYNKYIVNSGITMGTLLSAWEDFPAYFVSIDTNIPESADKVPDILNEILYNLRWMLTMQDPFDGGVYNKNTNAVFDGMVMPGVTKAPRYVVQKGTAASLDFTAVTAQASRVFRNFEKHLPGLADSCLRASVAAWKWAQQNPAAVYDQKEVNKHFEPDIQTGGYGDRFFDDERSWSAAELFITTKDKKYFDAYVRFSADSISLPGWSNVGSLGHYSLLRFQHQLPSYSQGELKQVKAKMIGLAKKYISNVNRNAFHTVMGQSNRDFVWGSNANAANQGIVMINAFLLTKDQKYLAYALTNVDYLLGRNATGYSFLTGYGTRTPMFPHHRPSVADSVEEPVPGLLVGGPNPGKQDKCTYEFSEPETAYADVACSYASNEIAINWNAPFVYLLHAVEALSKKIKH